MLKLAPSILSADFARLGEALGEVERAGAHYAHIDVMDGRFVDNISVGLPVVESLRKVSRLIFDVHLMIEEPERYAARFAEAGADIVCFHAEAARDAAGLARMIRGMGKKAGVAIKPLTPVESVLGIISEVDMVLVMSVDPGFGKQRLIPGTLDKARKMREYIKVNGLTCDVEMDGGIKLCNAPDVIGAGVNVLVAGTDVFGADDAGARVKEFLEMFGGYEQNY